MAATIAAPGLAGLHVMIAATCAAWCLSWLSSGIPVDVGTIDASLLETARGMQLLAAQA